MLGTAVKQDARATVDHQLHHLAHAVLLVTHNGADREPKGAYDGRARGAYKTGVQEQGRYRGGTGEV